MKQKLSFFFTTNTQGGFGVKRMMNDIEKNMVPIVKYCRGSVMLWCCSFSSKGSGNLIRIHGIMKYKEI